MIQPGPRRLHVLQLVGNAIVGGMESCVLRLIERLPADRCAITVLCPFESRFTERVRAAGADVVLATMPLGDPLWRSVQLACSLVQTRGIDVIQSHLSNAHLLAGIVGRMTGRGVLATIHGREMSMLDLEVHRSVGTHLSVVCRHAQLHALGIGVDPSRLHLVPNGVDGDVFKPRALTEHPIRARFGIAPDAPLVGYVARIDWEKGPDVFLRAMSTLLRKVPTVQAVMVGAGPMETEIRQIIEQYGLAHCVHLTGVIDDMPSVYPEFDVLISSSRSEAMPLVVMEAMASGVPVVATQVGGVPDLVQHALTGVLVGEGDSEALALQASLLLGAPATRQTMGAAARERMLKHYSIGATAEATEQLLLRLSTTTRPLRPVTTQAPAADWRAAEMSVIKDARGETTRRRKAAPGLIGPLSSRGAG